MFRCIFIYFLYIVALYSQNIDLVEKNGKFYYKDKLFTGIKKEEIFNRQFSDKITMYKEGVIVGKKRIIYEHLEFLGRYVKNGLISDEYIWDLDTNKIRYKNYEKGELISEGKFDYDYKRVGSWKWYFGEEVIREFDYSSLESRKEIKEETQWMNENGEVVAPHLDYAGFTGTIETKINEITKGKYQYKNGVLYSVKEFYSNGKLKHEMNLEKSFGRNYNGYEKWYYFNGNLERESVIEYKKYFINPLESALKKMSSPLGSAPKPGFYNRKKGSNVKLYYSTGELMSENSGEKTMLYDIEGNLIPLSEKSPASNFNISHNIEFYIGDQDLEF